MRRLIWHNLSLLCHKIWLQFFCVASNATWNLADLLIYSLKIANLKSGHTQAALIFLNRSSSDNRLLFLGNKQKDNFLWD